MDFERDIYASRFGAQEQILPRLDPILYDSTPTDPDHALSDEQLDFYEQNGYLVIPDVFTGLLPHINQEIERLKSELEGHEALYTEPGNDSLRTLFKPHAWSEFISQITRDPRILAPVQQLLGSAVEVMQSRVNVKPAFHGKSFPWHSDFETWHVEDGMPNMRALTAWIMLTDNTSYNGPLYVIPGSHKKYISCAGVTGQENYRSSLKHQTLGVPQPETMEKVLEDHPIDVIQGKAGSLVIHECNLLHGSPDNISADPRRILMFVYNSVRNQLQKPAGDLQPRPDYLCDRDAKPLKMLSQPLHGHKYDS